MINAIHFRLISSLSNRFKYMFLRVRAIIEKLEKQKLPTIRCRGFGPKRTQLFMVAYALVAAYVALAGFADAANNPYKDLGDGLDEALIDNSSYNNSMIRFETQNNITDAPVSITPGNGYYSSRPIAYDSKISSQTQMANKGTGASMERLAESSNGLSGSAEFMAAESLYRHGDSEYISATTMQMKIDESVTEGKVHIGALQKDSAPSLAVKGGTDSLMNAWQDPDLEIDEDYVGTYHIFKNMTINSSYDWKASTDSWLGCCLPNDYDMLLQDSQYRLPLPSADKVFSYNFQNSAASKAKR
jgi:hypothetical protein